MRIGLAMMLVANIFNVVDLATTFYAVNVLGFGEANVCASMLMTNPTLYTIVKIGSILMLSLIYVKSLKSEHPFIIGVNRGCFLGFCIMCFILGSASVLNILQILGCDVSQVLTLIARILPTLRIE